MADDDEEDCELTRDALQDSRLANEMRFVSDGQDLMDYLRRDGRYSDPGVDAPRPGIILLDLNMPKKDGREALAEIKSDESLRQIPVVVLTTSKDEEEVRDRGTARPSRPQWPSRLTRSGSSSSRTTRTTT
jgi:CheY-like chemotaxis protein